MWRKNSRSTDRACDHAPDRSRCITFRWRKCRPRCAVWPGRHDLARSMRQHRPQHDGVPVGRRVPERACGRGQASGWRDQHFLRNPLNQQLPRKFKIIVLRLRVGLRAVAAARLRRDRDRQGRPARFQDQGRRRSGAQAARVHRGRGIHSRARIAVRDGSAGDAAQQVFRPHQAREVAHQVPGRAFWRGRLSGEIPRGVRAHQTGSGRQALSARRMAHADRR